VFYEAVDTGIEEITSGQWAPTAAATAVATGGSVAALRVAYVLCSGNTGRLVARVLS
jgi:hypothetical protein